MKVQVMYGAQKFLPAADAALFQERMDGLTPTQKTASAALKKVAMLIEALEARGRFWDPAEHDGQEEIKKRGCPFLVR